MSIQIHLNKGSIHPVINGLFPAPDLIVEVLSISTQENDRGIKFTDYEAHQIMEYWIIDPDLQILEQYRLDDEKRYELILKAQKGPLICHPVTGFEIDIAAIFDEQKHLEAIKQLMA